MEKPLVLFLFMGSVIWAVHLLYIIYDAGIDKHCYAWLLVMVMVRSEVLYDIVD